MKKLLSVCLMSLMVLFLAACSEGEGKDIYKINAISGSEVLNQDEDAYIAYFYMPSCVHCQAFKQTLEKYIAQEDSLKVYPVNIELATEKSTWKRFNIQGTPTTVVVQEVNGKKEITQVIQGEVSLEEIPTKTTLKVSSTTEEDSNSDNQLTESTEAIPSTEITESIEVTPSTEVAEPTESTSASDTVNNSTNKSVKEGSDSER